MCWCPLKKCEIGQIVICLYIVTIIRAKIADLVAVVSNEIIVRLIMSGVVTNKMLPREAQLHRRDIHIHVSLLETS